MPHDVAQARQIDEALRLDDLELPEKPRVTALRWENYQDWSGEDSLHIWVILADETADEELTGEAVYAIKRAVRERLEAADVRLFRYFTFARESDLHNAPEQE